MLNKIKNFLKYAAIITIVIEALTQVLPKIEAALSASKTADNAQ